MQAARNLINGIRRRLWGRGEARNQVANQGLTEENGRVLLRLQDRDDAPPRRDGVSEEENELHLRLQALKTALYPLDREQQVRVTTHFCDSIKVLPMEDAVVYDTKDKDVFRAFEHLSNIGARLDEILRNPRTPENVVHEATRMDLLRVEFDKCLAECRTALQAAHAKYKKEKVQDLALGIAGGVGAGVALVAAAPLVAIGFGLASGWKLCSSWGHNEPIRSTERLRKHVEASEEAIATDPRRPVSPPQDRTATA